jgi:capsular polysaccharide biosynthesis protein
MADHRGADLSPKQAETESTHTAPASLPPDWDVGPTVLESLRQYWWLVCLIALIGAGLGVAYAQVQRDPVYTAETELSVGRVDVATQAIPGFVAASRTLADTYSRAISASEVVDRISRKTGLSESEVIERVTATPVPNTATMRVLAEAGTSGRAAAIANVASRTLVDYVQETNRFNPQTRSLLHRYRRAAADFSVAKIARTAAVRNGTVAEQSETQADLLEAKLKMRASAALYGSSQNGQASPNTLILLAPAGTADSDESSTTQRAGFAGAVGGILVGGLLALFLARRRRFS